MVFWQIALWALSLVISYRMQPSAPRPKPETLEDVQAPTADESRPIPKLYGTKWIRGPNVLWYGDLRTEEITTDGGRKYGLFGPKEQIPIGFRYYMGMHLGLALPVRTILGINVEDREAWRGNSATTIDINEPELFGGDEREGGIDGRLDVLIGAPDQEVHDYLAEQLPAPLPAFRGLTSLVWRQGFIGTSPYIKNWAVLASSVTDPPAIGANEWSTWQAPLNRGVQDMATDGEGTWMAVTRSTSQRETDVWRSFDNARTWEQCLHLEDTASSTGTSPRIGYGDGHFVMVVTMRSDPDEPMVWFTADQGDTWATPAEGQRPPLQGLSGGDLVWDGAQWLIARGRVPTGPYTGNVMASAGSPPQGWVLAHEMESNPGNICFGDANLTGTIIFWYPNGGGILRSVNAGQTWTFTAGAIGASTGGDACGIACGENRGDDTTWIAAGSSGVGVWISRDDGATWAQITDLPTNTRAVATDRRGNWIIGATSGQPIYRSTDDGNTWEEVEQPQPETTVGKLFSDGAGTWIVSSAADNRQLAYNLDGPQPDLLDGDMNPADIIIEALTDPVAGLGHAEADITTGDAFGSFDTARALFQSEGFGLSFLQNFQDSTESFIRSVQEHADAAVQLDPVTGKWIIVPIRDDYDAEELPVADPSQVVEVVEFYRPGYGELINHVTVTYDDRPAAKEKSITLHNNAVLALQGVVSAQTNNYPGISTADLANRVCARDLRQLSTPLARVELLLRPEFGRDLRAGSVFRWDWPDDGITGMVLRVHGINYGDLLNGQVRVKCTEDVFATAEALYDAPPASAWVSPVNEPQPVDVRRVMEAPYGILVRDIVGQTTELEEIVEGGGGAVLVMAQPPTGDALRYAIMWRPEGSPPAAAFEQLENGRFGLSSAHTSGSIGPEVSTTLVFPSAVDLSRVESGTLAMIGEEFMQVRTVAGTSVTFDRGVLDTLPQQHGASARVWFLGPGFGYAEEVFTAPDEIEVRLRTETARGRLDVSELDPDSHQDLVAFEARALRPYPPGNLTLNGERYPATLDFSEPLVIAWSHRDRVGQGEALVAQDEEDIGPEAGTTYTLRVTGLSAGEIVNESGITDTVHEVEVADLVDVAYRVELWSTRGGEESLQRHDWIVTTGTGLGFGLGLNLGGPPIVIPLRKFVVSDAGSISGAAYCASNGLVYVTLDAPALSGPSVIVYDAATEEIVDEIFITDVAGPTTPTPGAPRPLWALAATYVADVDRVFVGGRQGDWINPSRVYSIDPASHEVEVVQAGTFLAPRRFEYHPGNGLLYRIGRLTGDDAPSDLGNLIAFDPATGAAVGGAIDMADAHPVDLAYCPENGRLYVTQRFEHQVAVIDPTTPPGTVVDTIAIPTSGTLGEPAGIAWVPSVGRLFVACEGQNVVRMIDPATDTIDGDPIVVGESPWGLAYHAGTDRLYVCCRGANVGAQGLVSVIQLGTLSVVYTVPAGTYASWAEFIEAEDLVHVLNVRPTDRTVSVLT